MHSIIEEFSSHWDPTRFRLALELIGVAPRQLSDVAWVILRLLKKDMENRFDHGLVCIPNLYYEVLGTYAYLADIAIDEVESKHAVEGPTEDDSVGAHVSLGSRINKESLAGRERWWDSLKGASGVRYELAQFLGEGAEGSVFLATRGGQGERVAVKVFHKFLALNVDDISFSSSLMSAKSDFVCRHIDYGFAKGSAFVVMEHCDGGSLLDWLERQLTLVDERVLLHVGYQIASALSDLHGVGIHHGDVSLRNVLLLKRSSADQADSKQIDHMPP